ncbi:hypothetical protein P9850_12120 [Anoxybacillus rupiensis]|uniref:Mobilization protein n=1 Tax=Anoxybacteroides rupiense TaxID=311460 RepID=A0ABD5IW55_9BACL|nr:hypothetical protein [Anoxybacillus rupiensis]
MRKSEEEKLAEIELKMKQLQEKQKRLKAQIKEKERKQRTRRLIQIGAIFEKWFELESIQEAEQVARAFHESVKSNRDKWKQIPVQSSNEKENDD